MRRQDGAAAGAPTRKPGARCGRSLLAAVAMILPSVLLPATLGHGLERVRAGHVEWVLVWDPGMRDPGPLEPGVADVSLSLEARLDTGAATSSIDARDITIFQREGRDWVRFTLISGVTKRSLERPVLRFATVRRAATEPQVRPVVRLRVCVAGFTDESAFTLADRSGLDYPVLIGRSFLAERLLVDAGATHRHDASACAASK